MDANIFLPKPVSFGCSISVMVPIKPSETQGSILYLSIFFGPYRVIKSHCPIPFILLKHPSSRHDTAVTLLQDCCICFQAEPFLPHSTVPSPLLCVIFLRARRACIHWSPILWQSLYISKYNLLLSAHINHIKQDSSYFLYLHKTLTIFVPRYPLLFLFQTAPSLFSCPFSPLLCWGSNSCWASVLPRIYSSLMSLILN